MSKTTGPILVAGAVTWANQNLLSESSEDLFTGSVRIGVATGVLAVAMSGIERVMPDFAVALSWTALVTILFVRFNNKPTPAERILDIFESNQVGKNIRRAA